MSTKSANMSFVSTLTLLLLAFESSSAFTTRNLQGNVAEQVNELPAVNNDTELTYPDAFWQYLNDSFIIYDTFGVLNDTDAAPGFIEYAPMAPEISVAANSTGIELPVAYYHMTGANDSAPIPLYSIPPSFLQKIDNTTLVAMPSGVAPMIEPDAMFADAEPILLSTVPMQDMSVTIMDDFVLGYETTNETSPIKFVEFPAFMSNETESIMTPVVNTTEPQSVFVNNTEVFFNMTEETSPEVPVNVTMQVPEFVFTTDGEPENVTLQPPEFEFTTDGETESVTLQPPEVEFTTDGETESVTLQPPEVEFTTDGETESVTLQPPEVEFTATGETKNASLQPPEVEFTTTGEPENVTMQPPEVVFNTTGGEPPHLVAQPPMTLPIKNSVEVDAGKHSWWGLVKDTYKDVKPCKKKKNIAPDSGDKCSKKMEKTCFFGNQECRTAAYPATVCKCTAGIWSCSAATCP